MVAGADAPGGQGVGELRGAVVELAERQAPVLGDDRHVVGHGVGDHLDGVGEGEGSGHGGEQAPRSVGGFDTLARGPCPTHVGCR